MLDRDHYDIERVKDRILEFLAVRKLNPEARSSIVLFVGPPGVGKTSLGPLDRHRHGARLRAHVGGRRARRVGDPRPPAHLHRRDAGHDRAARSATPGSNNPVLMIDEIDKMGADFRGDPASAMLEVLDPEQNSTFRDHYLDVPVDLSNVFFICTANQVDTIPPALLDRMEVIELSGYTHEEKREIAKRYLVPRQMERNGVGRRKIEFTKPALDRIIDGYTREAGVRQLEREIGSICRKVAREFAEGTRRSKRTIRPETVEELLGKPRFQAEVKRRTSEPGRGHRPGLDAGGRRRAVRRGDRLPGRRASCRSPGQLGDVMKESAAAALSYVQNARRTANRVSPTGSRSTTCTSTCPPGRSRRTGRAPGSRWPPRSPRA